MNERITIIFPNENTDKFTIEFSDDDELYIVNSNTLEEALDIIKDVELNDNWHLIKISLYFSIKN